MSKAVVKQENHEVGLINQEAALAALYQGEDYGDTVQVEGGKFPTLRILQALSPAVEEGKGKPGEVFHDVAELIIPAPTTIIPIVMFTSYVIWKDGETDKGWHARSVDGVNWDKPNFQFELNKRPGQIFSTGRNVATSGLINWGANGEKPVADKSVGLFALIKDHAELGPLRILFRSTGLKTGVQFSQQLNAKRSKVIGGKQLILPPFAFQATLSVKKETGEVRGRNVSWYVPELSGLKELDVAGADKDIAIHVKSLYDMYKEKFRQAVVSETDNSDDKTPLGETEY